jgi:hypothetical protein
MAVRDSVKIVNGALDEVYVDGKCTIVLRGVIDPSSLDQLLTPPYQREILPSAKIQDLVEALSTNSVPDIELGMRGAKFRDHEDVFYLQDPTYIIDGLQRVTAARQLLLTGGEKRPHLGATIHFDTTEAWERIRFRVLNVARTKLSPNVQIRNYKETVKAIEALYNLTTHEKDFLMCGKVCWQQNMRRGEDIITALTLLKTIGNLHSHIGPGRYTNADDLVVRLNTIMERVGRNTFRANVRTFWELVDYCWGIRGLTYASNAAWLRGTFLWALSNLLMLHEDFWHDNVLFVGTDLQRKLKTFPVTTDPTIAQLAGASGKGRDMLLQLMIDHINSGKRTRRLTARPQQVIRGDEDDTPEIEENGNGCE